jgi:RHS repeat-associated protein
MFRQLMLVVAPLILIARSGAAQLVGCETFITITQYPPNPYYQGTTGSFTVEWGEILTEDPMCLSLGDPDPATFRFTVNGVDRTSYFTVGLNQATASGIPLVDETTNVFVATITGHDSNDNPRTDQDTRSSFVDTTPSPSVNTTPYNYDHQQLGRCAESCFTAAYAHTTPAYFTLDSPRSVTLVYHGDRASPRPFVHVDVSHPGGTYNVPQQFWLEVKRNGAFETFTNGETRLRFTGSSQTVRLGGQLRDLGNLATGVYDIQIVVSSQFSETKVEQAVINTKLTIVNENASPIARGWTVAGIQRLYPGQDANGSVLITEGGGSAVYFNRPCSNCSYTTPIGDFTTLVANVPAGTGWTRYYPIDSIRVLFDNAGRMTQAVNRFGDTTDIRYNLSGRLWQVEDPTNRAISFSYLTYGLSYISDPMSRITFVTVASDSTLRTIKDPDGDSTRFSYDGDRRLQMVYDRRGSRSRFAYRSQSWKLDSLILPPVPINGGAAESLVVRYSPWQIVGVPSGPTSGTPLTPVLPSAVQASVTDPEGHTTNFRPNRWGQPVMVRSPLGDSTLFWYSGSGLVTGLTYPWGSGDSYTYDSRGRLTSATPAGQATRNFRYGAFGQVDSTWGTDQAALRMFLNPTTGVADSIRIAGQDSIKIRNYFDSRRRLTRITDPDGHNTYFHYEVTFGNRDSVLAEGNGFVRDSFDTYGRIRLSQAHNGPWSRVVYDLLNRPIEVYDSLGATPTVLTYNQLDLIRVRDPKLQVYRFDVDNLGRVTRRYDPADTLNRYDSYRYDRDGRLVGWTNRRGQAVSYSYDALNRLLAKWGTHTSADSFGYSADFRRVVAWNSVSRDSTFLNSRLLADSVVTRLAGRRFRFLYRRNGVGALDSISLADTAGGLTFRTRRFIRHAALQQIDTMRLAQGWLTGFKRNRDGLVTQTTFFGDSPVTSIYRAYTLRHTLWRDSLNDTALTTALGRAWGYDSLSRVLREIRGRPSGAPPGRAFVYDRMGRLAQERFGPVYVSLCGIPNPAYGYVCPTFVPDSVHTFSYDAVGNRTDNGGTYAAGNRILTFGQLSFWHDLDGNVSRKAGVQDNANVDINYYWSAEGRLDSVTSQGNRRRYEYDAYGRLLRKRLGATVDRHFLWDPVTGQLVAELDATGTQRIAEYAYYPGIDRPWALITAATRYFTQDVLGNVIGVVQGTTAAQTILYDAWGLTTVSGGSLGDTNRLRWKGLMWEGDVTQLYYVRNRWYEPRTGRFVSEDPIGLGGGMNPYSFAAANPIGGFDPSGLEPRRKCKDFTNPDCWTWVLDPIEVTAEECGWWCLLGNESPNDGDGALNPWDAADPGGVGGGQPIPSPHPEPEHDFTGCLVMSGLALGTAILDFSTLLVPGSIIWRGLGMRMLAKVAIREGSVRTASGIAALGALHAASRSFEASVTRAPGALVRSELQSAPVVLMGGIATGGVNWRDFVPIWGTARAIRNAARSCGG